MPTKITCVNATIFFLFLSFGAQLIGFCIPGWLHIILFTYNPDEKMISQNFALWYVVICWKGMCLAKTYSHFKHDRSDVEEDNGFNDDWRELRNYDYTAEYSSE